MVARCLIDAGPIIAYFDAADDWHEDCSDFIDRFRGQFFTTAPVITEVMWILRSDYRVQNEFLLRVARGLFRDLPLSSQDLTRIAELNERYSNIPADYADLSLVAISERLELDSIVTLDRDFDIYRRRVGQVQRRFKRITP